MLTLFKERASTTLELAQNAMLFYRIPQPQAQLVEQHITDAIRPALQHFVEQCASVEWDKAAISAAMKTTLAQYNLKMPQLAMPLRLLVTGQLQTPSIDAVLALFNRQVVIARIQKGLS